MPGSDTCDPRRIHHDVEFIQQDMVGLTQRKRAGHVAEAPAASTNRATSVSVKSSSYSSLIKGVYQLVFFNFIVLPCEKQVAVSESPLTTILTQLPSLHRQSLPGHAARLSSLIVLATQLSIFKSLVAVVGVATLPAKLFGPAGNTTKKMVFFRLPKFSVDKQFLTPEANREIFPSVPIHTLLTFTGTVPLLFDLLPNLLSAATE